MENLEIPKYTVFVRHGYLQQAAAVWKLNHRLQCNIYVISAVAYFKDAFAFSYGVWLRRESGLPGNDRSKREEDQETELNGDMLHGDIRSGNEDGEAQQRAQVGTEKRDTRYIQLGSDVNAIEEDQRSLQLL